MLGVVDIRPRLPARCSVQIKYGVYVILAAPFDDQIEPAKIVRLEPDRLAVFNKSP
ncbi:hypothetical protein D3C84_1188630 [compost metagenome]